MSLSLPNSTFLIAPLSRRILYHIRSCHGIDTIAGYRYRSTSAHQSHGFGRQSCKSTTSYQVRAQAGGSLAQVRFISWYVQHETDCTSLMICLTEDAGKDVRASIYRLLRHLIVDQHDVDELKHYHFDLLLIRYVEIV